MKLIIVLMGVCGTGKSAVAQRLKEQMKECDYIEADEYHSDKNKEKMSNGKSLTDDDRHDWLLSIRDAMVKSCASEGQGYLVVACSALRESYRAKLSEGLELQCRFVHLKGPKELIKARLESRNKHFMNPSLLESQIETLEEPATAALTIDVERSLDAICELIQSSLMQKSSWFGVCGMGVMGTSLARNLASKGVPISLYNRVNQETNEIDVAHRLLEKFPCFSSSSSKCSAFDGDLERFVSSLQVPRKILIMATAGRVVDVIISSVLPHLERGDVIIDAGNSHFIDTERRQKELWDKGVHLVGCGVSGGEEGALKGPAIMPGGQRDAVAIVKPYLEAIASRDRDGKPCCAFMGEGGSGHFVKTVHNGMEYAEMQLLGEVYNYLKVVHRLDNEAIATCLEGWQDTQPLSRSYLMEITVKILRKQEAGECVIDSILDKSGNKGTGNWTAVAACELGQPTTMVASSLFARYLSSQKDQRVRCESSLLPENNATEGTPLPMETLCEAYILAKVTNHLQGMQLLDEANSPRAPEKYSGVKSLDLAEICRVWTAGCILRSELLQVMRPILLQDDGKAGAAALLDDPELQHLLKTCRAALKHFVASCIVRDVAAPCFSEALQFLVGLTTGRSASSALIQAQRDFFGSHGYQRLSDDTGTVYHTLWDKD
jgi:6-phosphogluconate dehydrogenase